MTLRLADHVWNLRSQRSFAIVHRALSEVRRRADFRVAHFSVQGELEASVPVTWRSPDTFYPYGYLWQAPTVTATTLTQTIAAPPDGFPAMSGNAYIAVPAGDQFGAGMIVDIQQ